MWSPCYILTPLASKDITFLEMKLRFEIIPLVRIASIIMVVKLNTLKPSTTCYRDSNIGTLVQF
jgi:hypothetical protein